MRLAFIVQRYGREILGGAETLARQIAERLGRRHDITVLTTTARDYITWRNEYPAGEEKHRGVRILRFPVEGERNLEEFNRFSEWIYKNPHSREDEFRWLEMQGPIVPQLVDRLRKDAERYDLLVFFTYLYYPTYYGIRVSPEKSVLVPTAHDEPPLKLEIYGEMFQKAGSFIFNSEAEELLVLERFGVYKKMRETIGIGMELLDQPDTAAFRKRYKLSGRFLLYAGRIDEGKGCDELIRYFRFYREEHPRSGKLQLVLMGNLSMKLPQARDIRYLGFLAEEDKLAAMAAATAVVIPSRYESLSIVALEAFSVGTPVIVNRGSPVLVDHCRKANAGLYYSDFEDFEEILHLMLGDKVLQRNMGKLGQRYVKEQFGWDKLLPRYELAFRSSSREPRPRPPAPGPPRPESRPAPEEQPSREPMAAPQAPPPPQPSKAPSMGKEPPLAEGESVSPTSPGPESTVPPEARPTPPARVEKEVEFEESDGRGDEPAPPAQEAASSEDRAESTPPSTAVASPAGNRERVSDGKRSEPPPDE
ncbi:MAG: glycosyltransferase [Acidobacteriota bacterium]